MTKKHEEFPRGRGGGGKELKVKNQTCKPWISGQEKYQLGHISFYTELCWEAYSYQGMYEKSQKYMLYLFYCNPFTIKLNIISQGQDIKQSNINKSAHDHYNMCIICNYKKQYKCN